MIDTNMKLSEHFTLGEMIKTSVKVNEFAKQNGLGEEEVNNLAERVGRRGSE